MDFLGAMFEGIGKTFEAGANVNLGQIGERMQKRQLAFDREALEAGSNQSRLEYLLNSASGERQILIIAVIAVIIVIVAALIFKK